MRLSGPTLLARASCLWEEALAPGVQRSVIQCERGGCWGLIGPEQIRKTDSAIQGSREAAGRQGEPTPAYFLQLLRGHVHRSMGGQGPAKL